MFYEPLGLVYYTKYAIDNASPDRARVMRAEDRAIENADLDNPAVSLMLKKNVLDMVYGTPEQNMLSAALTQKIKNKYFPAGQLRSDPTGSKGEIALTTGNQPVITYKSPEVIMEKDPTARPVPEGWTYPTEGIYHKATVIYMDKELSPEGAKQPPTIPGGGSTPPEGGGVSDYTYAKAKPAFNVVPWALAGAAGLAAFLMMR